MENQNNIMEIRQLIANNKLKTAFQQIQELLINNPDLDIAILQSARYQGIQNQINSGVITHENAEVAKNQIRASLLDLLRNIENFDENSPPTDEENTTAPKDTATVQKADKIYNINNIDQANFS